MHWSFSFDLMPYLLKLSVKQQSPGYLIDSGSHQKSYTKILSYTSCWWKSNAVYCSYKLAGSVLVLVTEVRAFQNHVQIEAYAHVVIIDRPHLLDFNAKTQFLRQVSSTLLISLSSVVVTLPYLWNTWGKCLSILGENCVLLDVGKGIRELPVSFGLISKQFADRG